MKHFYLTGICSLLLICSCSKVPLSNRHQINLLPESQLVDMSLTEYKTFLTQNPPVAAFSSDALLVKKVGNRIQQAVVTYLAKNNMSDRIAGYNWEYNLVNEPTVNAWCMPGGKVVVYSGLLAVTQNETALAIVLGHEISHAVARHGNERMSQQMVAQLGGTALDVALQNKSAETRAIFSQAYGIGSNVAVLLPFSRLQESEADKLGLIFAAMAGYDPREAPKFWKRMAAMGGAKPPALLSTHPSDEKRIADINSFMGEAMKYYKPRN